MGKVKEIIHHGRDEHVYPALLENMIVTLHFGKNKIDLQSILPSEWCKIYTECIEDRSAWTGTLNAAHRKSLDLKHHLYCDLNQSLSNYYLCDLCTVNRMQNQHDWSHLERVPPKESKHYTMWYFFHTHGFNTISPTILQILWKWVRLIIKHYILEECHSTLMTWALVFSLVLAWTNGWINRRIAVIWDAVMLFVMSL